MRDSFPALGVLADGDYAGAETWLNPLLNRGHWLYGQAHCRQYMQRQGVGQTTGSLVVWEGETRYRAEHPTLNISARIALSAAAPSAVLQYYGSDSIWHTFTGGEDNNAGDRWFGGSASLNFDCSGLSLPADGMLRVRFVINAGSASVYWVVMMGWVGLATWPTFVTYANSPTVHTAAQFNLLRTAQEYLLDCAEQPALASEMAKAVHTQEGAYEPLLRYVFRHSARTTFYCYLTVAGLPESGHAYVYLEDAQYPHGARGATRIATLVDVTANGTAAHTYDLSTLELTQGLTRGTRYSIEVGTTNSVEVTVYNMQTLDPAAVTRAYLEGEQAHGDQPTAAQLNNIKADLDAMYPASDRQSPIFFGHEMQQHAIWDSQGLHTYSQHGFILCHRWRYLRWRGAGVLRSVDGLYEQSLSDTSDSAGEPQVMDLESLSWLGYGMQYRAVSEGSKVLLSVQEDYAP